jgi:TRAP-type C4-dicarboxylate transport system permease small subunit
VIAGLRRGVDRMVEGTLVVLMSAMVLNVLWQIFTRFVLRDPSSYTEELARFLLIWVGLLGACYALRQGMHLAIDALVARLGQRTAKLASLLSLACVGGFGLGVMVIGGAHLVQLTLALEQTSAALRVPLGYVYLALPLCGGLILFYTVATLFDQE